MARSFLPPPSPGTSYPVQSANGRFSEGDAGLLSHVGANMAVAEAQTEGRVPSPLSRAYMFYTALSGESLAMTGNQDEGHLAAEGRRVLREKARATFRGVAAVFALRGALGLTIDLRAVPITQVADPVARVLGPNLNGAPGGPAYWQNVRLFTVRAGSGAPQVLGGLSPLTSFFPAANPPSQALAGVFWYTPPSAQSPTGTWNDPTGVTPTGGTTPLSPTTQGVVRAALAEWVRSVRTDFREDDLQRQGVTREGVALIKAELDAWARDLAGAAAVPGVGVVAGAIGRPPGQEVPAFLEATCVGDALDAVLSDLPLHAGRLVVSSRALGDPTLRVWGATFGAADLGDRAQALPASGANLGAALGMGDTAAAVPFVVLDRLFTPRFTLLTQGGVADEWRALPVENHGSTEHALFPFAPELLELLSPDELSGATTANLSSDTLNYVVELTVGDQKVTQLYATSGQGEYALDLEVSADTVDVRLFPNFDLDAVRGVLPTDADGGQPDARYYARVRLGPDWTFGVRALHVDGADGERTVTTTAAAERRGSKTAGSPGAAPPGEADFFTLDRRPDGFLFEGRGICLLDLRPPVDPEVNEQTWDVAVDFGTSNTSVAFRPADGSGTARPFPFPVMTTTLLRTPIYGSMGSVNEGHSAVADFFFKLSAEDGDLVSPPQYPNAATPYFPTQIVTRQTELPGGTSDFDLSAGLILFQNGILSGVGLLQILNGFDLQSDSGRLTKRFHLQQDIKWTRRTWLRAFMAHLRLQVVLTAAREKARVNTVLFSYPKAFNDQEEQAYERALRSTWGDLFGGLLSESEAVRTILGGTANQHIVLDVGGGTTDVIGFHAGTPSFQTSFKLASGQVNDYVVGSPEFRSAFRKAIMAAEITGLTAGQGGLTLKMFEDGTETQLLNVWVGLLQSIEYADPSGRALTAVTSALAEAARGDDPEARAVRGFFLTTAVLFGGLAYATGRLLRLASDGEIGAAAFSLNSVRVALTGNGSKLINLLSSDRWPFDRVFRDLFRRGLVGTGAGGDGQPHPAESVRIEFDGVYTLDGVPAPKATVALGLLDGGIDPAEREVPTANVALEDVAGTDADGSLVAFYGRMAREPGAFTPGRTAPPQLAAFLDALGGALPNGHNGKRMVIPGVGPDWVEPLKTDTFADATGVLLDRLAENAGDLPPGAATPAGAAYVPALEPVLIAEIAALLDQIREDH